MPTIPKDSESEILEVFEECQLNNLSHDRLCVKLKNIYDNTRFTHFADDFFELCRYSLVSSERSLYRERTIDFITKFALFCGKSDDSNQDTLNNRLLLKLFLFCIKYNECPNPAVRFRCMQIIHKLLDGIGDNGIMPEELYRSLQSILLRRVYDTKVSVRVEAIQALSRMQDPTDAECPVVEAFIWLTRHDPTAEVRRAALAAMVLTTRTLPSLVERCRDLADNVRRAAYKLLASRGILRPLSIAKRIRILQDGLSDRSEEVRKATKELVLAWFNGTNRDPVLLLRRLDPEGDPSTSQKALDSLFEMLSPDDLLKVVQEWSPNYLTSDRILKSDCLTPEATFFWRALVEFIHKRQINANDTTTTTIKSAVHPEHEDNNEENNPLQRLADIVQPSVSVYVDLAKTVVDKLVQTVLAQEFDEKAIEQECVVEQILSMAGSLDLSDEFGRRRLVSLVHDWITSQQVSGTLAPQLLKLHAILEPNLRRRINSVIEMISELCDPVEPQNSLGSAVSVPVESNENGCLTKETECTNQQPALSKKKEISIRLKIASLEVRMNELNEALHDCVSRKEFERATELRDACNKLDIERTELLQELRGNIGILTDKPPVSPSSGSDEQIKSVTKEDLNTENPDGGINNDKNDGDDDNDEVDAAEDATQGLFKRCSSSVLFKANKMAALIIQQSPTLWSLPASLRSLLDSLILPSMQHSDVAVRNQAILALGLCCTMDLPLTLQYIHVFYSAMRVDHLMISETALGCIIDCLLIYGFRPFHDANINPNSRLVPTDTIIVDEDDDDEEEQNIKASKHDYVVLTRQTSQDSIDQSHSNPLGILVRCDEMSKTAYRLLKPITSLLEKESDDGLRSTSALGLAKLLIYDRIVSSHILSLLLLLWFNPVSEESPQLRRGLAYFFADYACANGIGMDAFEHQSALTNAVLPTLTTLIRAPASSPLSEVEPNDVASLLARLTDTTHLKSRSEGKNVTVNQEGKDIVNDDNEDSRPNSNKSKTISSSTGQIDEKIINPHHDRLVSILATEVLKAPQSAEAKLYLRMIFQLRPSTENIQVHKELLTLVDSMSKFADRSLNLTLHRFRKQLIEKMERLGIDSKKLNESIISENGNDKINTSPLHDDDDSNHTIMNNEGIQQSQPTLLGSARVNFHLVNSSEHHIIEKNQGNATMIFSQSNRTMTAVGNPLLDKSSHQNLLDFSDDDDEEEKVDCDLTPTSIPVSSTNPSSKQIKPKKNTATVVTRQKNVNNNSQKNPIHKISRGKVVLQSSDNENSNSVKSHSTTNSRSRNPKKLKHSQKKIDTSSSSPTSSVSSSRRSTRLSSAQKSDRRI
uniref:Cnd3 domain-containing protein n=1 Tax=Schistosoma mansoni TaxID=6183 RepID=A0A3Q0KI66_SCHMA